VDTTHTRDSITTTDNTLQVDSSYVERMIKKLMPGSAVGFTLSPGEYDSLVRALKSLPPELRTIYKIDPTLQTKFTIMLDSLGNLKLMCQTLDRYYFEKDVASKKTIHRLTQELTTVKEQLNKKEVRQVKPNVWDNIKGWLKAILVIAVLLLAVFFTGLLKRK